MNSERSFRGRGQSKSRGRGRGNRGRGRGRWGGRNRGRGRGRWRGDRGRGGWRGRNRGRGGYRRQRGRGRYEKRGSYRGYHSSSFHHKYYQPYDKNTEKDNRNALYESFYCNPRSMQRKWKEGYHETQELSKPLKLYPLSDMRDIVEQKLKNNSTLETKISLKYHLPDIVQTFKVKKLATMNWDSSQNEKLMHFYKKLSKNLRMNFLYFNKNRINSIDYASVFDRIEIPVKNIDQVYNPPQVPFRMWRKAAFGEKAGVPYVFPHRMPILACAVAVRKLLSSPTISKMENLKNIDWKAYDFVSLRRSIKRILSSSVQMNTNFQMINNTIFCEDIAVNPTFNSDAFGLQFEKYVCSGQSLVDVQNENISFSPLKDLECSSNSNSMEFHSYDKNSDMFYLMDVTLNNDLKMLLFCEIDCEDKDGNPIELKLSSKESDFELWTQLIFADVHRVIEGLKTYQTYCCVVYDLNDKRDVNLNFSENTKIVSMNLFYNILKDIQQRCLRDVNGDISDDDVIQINDGDGSESEDIQLVSDDEIEIGMNDNVQLESKELIIDDDIEIEEKESDNFRCSKVYRLSRDGSHTHFKLFHVKNSSHLIQKEDYMKVFA